MFLRGKIRKRVSNEKKDYVPTQKWSEMDMLKKVEKRCKELSNEGETITFLGWNGKYRGPITRLILESSVYGRWDNTNLRNFLSGVSKPSFLGKEYAKKRILEVCKEISTDQERIEFRGFCGDFKGSESKLILYNSKYDLEWTSTKYSDFFQDKTKRPKRYINLNPQPKKPQKLSEEVARERINSKCEEISTPEETITFLGFSGEWKGIETKLKLNNSKLQYTWEETTYDSFIHQGIKSPGAKNRGEKFYLERIERICKEISTPEETITFLGWRGGEFIDSKTGIILHNSKYNITWDTSNCNSFTSTRNKLPNTHTSKKLMREEDWWEVGGRRRSTQEEFLEKYREKFPNSWDRYDLSKAIYLNSTTKLTAICHEKDESGEEHGEFMITPGNLLSGYGCPKCQWSLGELRISNYLKFHDISFTSQFSVDSSLLPGCPNKDSVRIDFSLEYEGRKIWIEFNGVQHYKYSSLFQKTYSDFERQQARDDSVREYAKDQGIELLEIPYTDLSRISEILDEFLGISSP